MKMSVGAALIALAVCALALAQGLKATDAARIGVVELKIAKPEVTDVGKKDGKVIPWHINYQGYLTDDLGSPINGNVNMDFSVWTASSGGSELWSETQVVAVEEGLFNVVLGGTPIPASVFETGESRWLQLAVEGQTLLPRTEITSVGYAYRSVKADTADYAFAAPATPDNDWAITGNVLHPVADYGLAMRQSNVLYGDSTHTHVDFGVACTTGTSGQNFRYCTVSGGSDNTAAGEYATVGGGQSNMVSAYQATVGGGYLNTASWTRATVAGGYSNTASDWYATVGGGSSNTASGQGATVSGGYADTVAGDYSCAAGRQVRVTAAAAYTFAFGRDFTTTTPNAVVFHDSVNPIRVGIGTVSPTDYLEVTPGGAHCDGTTWINASSREGKKDIEALTPEEYSLLLEKVKESEVVWFRYRIQENDELHIGVIAEDAPEEMVDAERTGIPTGDAIGFLLAAIKAQQEGIDSLREEVEALKQR